MPGRGRVDYLVNLLAVERGAAGMNFCSLICSSGSVPRGSESSAQPVARIGSPDLVSGFAAMSTKAMTQGWSVALTQS